MHTNQLDKNQLSLPNDSHSARGVVVIPPRLKRTMPYVERCEFLWVEDDLVMRCEESADLSLYFGNDYSVSVISLCSFHRITQEEL
jgi:hypothetical protein